MSSLIAGLERVEILARSGMVPEAAALLNRAAGRAAPLRWIGDTATALASLPSRGNLQAEAIAEMLHSPAAERALRSLSRDEFHTVQRILHSPRPPISAAPEEAWRRLAHGAFSESGAELRTSLAAIRRGGGIGAMILAAERTLGPVNGRDYQAAVTALRDLETRYLETYRGRMQEPRGAQLKAAHRLFFAPEAYDDMRQRKPRVRVEDAFAIKILLDFLEGEPIFRELARRNKPLLLTHLLRGRKAEVPHPAGPCHAVIALAGDLLTLSGADLGLALHTQHGNLLDRRLGLVLELTGDPPFLSLLETWQAIGTLGENQPVAPLEALLAGTFLNLGVVLNPSDPTPPAEYNEAALKVYPDYPAALMNLSLDRRKPAARRRLLERAVAIHPRYAAAQELLARLSEQGGNLGRAAARYEVALSAMRQNLEATARAYRGYGFFGPRAGDLARVQGRLGAVYEMRGMRGRAARIYRQALRTNPFDYQSMLRLANATNEGGRPAEAEALFKTVAAKAPNTQLRGAAWFGLGWIAWARGETSPALLCFARAIRLCPRYRRSLDGAVAKMVQGGNQAGALRIARRFFPERFAKPRTTRPAGA